MKHSLTLILILAVTVAGCGLLPPPKDPLDSWSASKLYSEAKSELTDGNYEKAVKYFEKLESRYPYGRYAQQAQLEVGYAYFKQNEPASAIAAADRFIKLHPNHSNVDYAYYLKGLANFNENQGILTAIGKQDMTERDPKAAKESFDSFKELVTRFPESKYSPDAAARMNYLIDALASHEVHVARYYMRRGAYVAAVNRAQYALQQYPRAPAIEEALAVMVKSYDALGMKDLRDDALRVMQKNFPKSEYLSSSTKSGKPWWQLW